MRRAKVASAALVAALMFVPSFVRAQSAADLGTARELFKEGAEAAQKGDWEASRKAYSRSLVLKRSPMTLYGIAVAEKNTGHLLDALEHFRAFAASPSTPTTQPYAQTARDGITELEKRVARVLVKIEPAGVAARVMIDGVEVPAVALDHARFVDPGSHEIIASAKSYASAKQTAVLPEGGSTTVTLKLQPAAPEAAPAPLAHPQALPPPSEPSPLRPTVEPPNRTLPIALIIGGGALFAGGVVVGMLGLSQASNAPFKQSPEVSSAKTKGVIGDVMGGAGIVAAGIGVVLFATAKPKKLDAAWTIAPYAAGETGGVRVRF